MPDTRTAGLPAEAAARATDGEHWIDVNLTQQSVDAYAGSRLVNSFLASTGALLALTVTGAYHI